MTVAQKNSKVKQNDENKNSSTLTAAKVIISILLLSSIPVFLYNPDLSLGPLDILRRDFFKTEIILSGERINSDGLVKSIRLSNNRLVKLYVRSGLDVNALDSAGISPLCVAAETGNLAIIDSLLSTDVNLVRRNKTNGLTPIYCAIKGNNIQVIDRFIQAGMSINTRNEHADGISPIHYASALGKDAVVSYLIKVGANVNVADLSGKTPLHMAAAQNNIVVLFMLLNAGAIVDVRDDNGDTPIDIAEKSGHNNYIELLERHGASESIKS